MKHKLISIMLIFALGVCYSNSDGVCHQSFYLRPLAMGEQKRLILPSDARYKYFMLDYQLRYQEQKGLSSIKARQQVEELFGQYRDSSRSPSGYEVLISDQEIEELAHILERLRLGFIFEDGLTYARTFCPNPAGFVHSIATVAVPVRTSKKEITLRPEILMSDISLDPNFRDELIQRLNFDIYPDLRIDNFEGGYTHFFEDTMQCILQNQSPTVRQQIIGIMKLSLDSIRQRNLPSPSLDTAKRLVSTLFFHEIGEVLFATLPHDLRQRWQQLIRTPGTRPVPGIILFKNQLKVILQSAMGGTLVFPERGDEENFADIFAMSVYPDNVYNAFGETLKPEWKAFVEEVLRYLRNKHQQGGNIWTIEDPEAIQESEKMGIIVERDPFEADARQKLADLIRPFLEAQIGTNALRFNKILRDIALGLSKVKGPFTGQNVNLAFQTAKVNLSKGKPGEIADCLNRASIHSNVQYIGDITEDATVQNMTRNTLEESILRPVAAGEKGPPLVMSAVERSLMETAKKTGLVDYLKFLGNSDDTIESLIKILANYKTILLEVGCGRGRESLRLAKHNPGVGVIAIDQYKEGMHFNIALQFSFGNLAIQEAIREKECNNLVLLRAETNIINFFPHGVVNNIIMVNPDPQAVARLLYSEPADILTHDGYIVIKPYSEDLRASLDAVCSSEFTLQEENRTEFLGVNLESEDFLGGCKKLIFLYPTASALARLLDYDNLSAISKARFAIVRPIDSQV